MDEHGPPITHLPLSMTARPARLALLIPMVEGISWPAMFESALAAQASIWGGVGNLPFPLDDRLTENEVFWAIADLFDPDAFVTYAPVLGEMSKLDPAFYEKTIQEHREQLSEAGEDAVSRFIEEAKEHVVLEVQPSERQLELIRQRLAPLPDRASKDRIEHFNGATGPGWPFTDVTEFNELPEQIESPIAPTNDAVRQLLVTAVMGSVPEALKQKLAEREVKVEITERALSQHAWSERIRMRGSVTDQPWRLSDVGLGTFRTRAMIDAPATLVVGDSPWDFVLYYALLRLTGLAWWLPSWLADDSGYVTTLGRAIEFDARHEARDPLITSTSAPRKRLEEVASELPRASRTGAARIGEWREALPHDPQRLAALDSETRNKLVQVFEGRVLELDTMIPRTPSTSPPAYMRWVAEARSPEWAPIRHAALAEYILPDLDRGNGMARASREGVSYFPMGAMVWSSASLEGSVLRPSMRPLDLEGQLTAIFRQAGWRCQPSDKGIYARESMRLFGGLDELCKALRDPKVRLILDAYMDPKDPGPQLTLDRRCYLTWSHFEELLGEDTRTTVRPLQDSGVLTRGVVLKCARCRQIAWHRSGLVTDSFTCERCSLTQDADRNAWFDQDEPILSYRMAEVVFQLLTHRGELPLLAVNDQFSESRQAQGQSFELDVWTPEGEKHEVDIFRSDGSRLWIGEASTNGRFDDGKLAFLARLAQQLNAHGVLLATSEPSWPEATKEEAEGLWDRGGPQLQMRHGVVISAN